MATTLKPYPAYKPAGVPWLQQVPEHWDMLPNRGLVRKRKVLVGKRHKEYQLLSLTKQGIIVRDLSTGKGKFSADMGTSQEVRKGDLVFCLFDVPETPRTVGLSSHDGMITSAYTVFETIGSGSAEYFDYYYRAMDDRKMLGPLYSGLRNTIPLDRLLVAKTPLPPPDEQHLIVRYLHTLDAKVKRYIRTKRTLIARLQEQKQAIIQRAVTRGLDPNVKLKPSGVEWLGEVPEHWLLRRFKFVAQIRSGQVDPRQAPFRSLVLIAPNHIQSGTGKLIAQQTAHEQGADSGKYLVEKGEVVYSKIRPNLRKATIAPFNCLCSADMYPISPSALLLPEYLLLIILSPQFTKFAVDTSMRAAMPKINREDLANCWLWFPDTVEQQEILDSIEREGRPYDAGVANSEREIQLMLEYHTRLIADVVTGAVDVREAAKTMENVAPVEEALADELELETEVEEELDTSE